MKKTFLSKIYGIVGLLVIVILIITAITFTFGIILAGAVLVGLYTLYRSYASKKRSRKFKERTKGFSSGEIVDITSDEIHSAMRDRRPNK
jgi:uncharacterized membrane protein